MKFYKIIKSDSFLKKISISGYLAGITLWPFIIVKKYAPRRVINHEEIHIKQQIELLVILFYIIYLSEWIIGLIRGKSSHDAYMNISFEKEAYANENNLDYIKNRKPFSFLKYY